MHPNIPRAGGIFEGFAVEVADGGAKARVRKALSQLLGGWKIRRFGDRKSDFELRVEGGELSERDAWNATYALRDLPGIVYAEPLFATSVSDNPEWLRQANVPPDPPESDAMLTESADPAWALDAIRVREAWRKFFTGPDKAPGHGIRVGHPDTGYQDHPEVVSGILANEGYDFLNDDTDAHDDLERPGNVLLPNPGHGTGTSSVIVSAAGSERKYPGKGWVCGVAPGARLMPLRTVHSVVLVSSANLARAIEYAALQNVHVLSISLGGLFSWRLRQAIAFAQERGVIICCAAGNYAPFVGWPAAYDEVIACAASNARGGVWQWGCHGRAVDVTAPGESVWRATVEKREGQLVFDVGRGSGTSYATTHVAGLAALWLSYHGYDSLVDRYGKKKLPFVFNRLLRSSSVTFPGWEEGEYGAGLVDAVRMLDTKLPDPDEIRAGPYLDRRASLDEGGFATFAHLFSIKLSDTPAPDKDGVRTRALVEALSSLLGTSMHELAGELSRIGQELAFLFATDPQAYVSFKRIIENQLRSQEFVALRQHLAARASTPLRSRLSAADKIHAGALKPPRVHKQAGDEPDVLTK